MIYRDDLIRAQKAAQKLTLQDLADKSGLHVNTISEICKGKDSIEIPTLKKVADALDLPMYELFMPKRRLIKAI